MKYRADIDGLRAVAVVPVILFHAGFELFSGGFVGVDVFFVISGYLITTILINELDDDRFSIINFYERRARRILPALFLITFLCIPFAWIWMLPSQLEDFSHSLIAVSLFASNIFFWRESDYFWPAAEEMPLLHTWSLAVEEQYYVLFPIFLLIAWRYGKNNVLWTIIVFAGISFVISEWAWRNFPTANFYLAPTRAWELFAGSLAAFVANKHGVQSNNFLSILGLSAIIFSIFIYDEHTPFPSVYALLPVLGVVLVVLFGRSPALTGRLLSAKIFVGVGLISYSAYLWHQPLFAFARINHFGEPSSTMMGGLALLSIFLASVSYRYIEKPFRNRNFASTIEIFSYSVVLILLTITIGLIGHFNSGFDERFSSKQRELINTAEHNPKRSECHFPQKEEALSRIACEYFGKEPNVAVFGNSHATELAYALAQKLEPSNLAIKHHTMSGCKHNFGKIDEIESICQRWAENVVRNIVTETSLNTVIVSFRNEYYLHEREYRESLVKMLDELVNAGKRVIYVLQAPLADAHIHKYINRAIANDLTEVAGLTKENWIDIYNGKDELLDKIPDDVEVVDPADILCRNGDCLVISDNKSIYFDDHHLSIFGAGLVAEKIHGLISEKED